LLQRKTIFKTRWFTAAEVKRGVKQAYGIIVHFKDKFEPSKFRLIIVGEDGFVWQRCGGEDN
jgi:hypothetical protein